jgi:hypothetical protein
MTSYTSTVTTSRHVLSSIQACNRRSYSPGRLCLSLSFGVSEYPCPADLGQSYHGVDFHSITPQSILHFSVVSFQPPSLRSVFSFSCGLPYKTLIPPTSALRQGLSSIAHSGTAHSSTAHSSTAHSSTAHSSIAHTSSHGTTALFTATLTSFTSIVTSFISRPALHSSLQSTQFFSRAAHGQSNHMASTLTRSRLDNRQSTLHSSLFSS